MRLEEAIKDLGEKINNEDFCWPSEKCRQEHEQLLVWLQELIGLRFENEVILRRLKHLLESDYISQFDRVDPHTKEYIHDIREADRKVMYLCDKEKPCKEHCEKYHHCKRTSDISHAKNFRLVPNGVDPIIYEEVDEHCIANIMFDREELEKIVNERVIEPIKNGELVIKPHDWIPVSERLPEEFQRVLVWFEYYRYGDYNCMYQTYGFGYVCDGKWSPFINGETGWQDARIIAWMTLPEAYKEADND